MSKEVAKAKEAGLPAHLQGGKTTKVGNIDSSDLIIPRIKLLQSVSPELVEFDNTKQGNFWHTVASEMLGKELRAVPIIVRKSYVLWAPRGDDRGILARANDGLNWDNAGMEFTVKPKNSPHDVTYKLGKTVHEKTGDGPALSEFGSSIPGDPNSAPAAALTYQFLWYLLDYPELSPVIIINTRSSVRPAKALISKIDLRPVDHFAQVYKIGVTAETNDANEAYFNYNYISDGYADEETFAITKALYERFSEADWKANDESEEADKKESSNAAFKEGGGSGKF